MSKSHLLPRLQCKNFAGCFVLLSFRILSAIHFGIRLALDQNLQVPSIHLRVSVLCFELLTFASLATIFHPDMSCICTRHAFQIIGQSALPSCKSLFSFRPCSVALRTCTSCLSLVESRSAKAITLNASQSEALGGCVLTNHTSFLQTARLYKIKIALSR